jgi:hypothetical protein
MQYTVSLRKLGRSVSACLEKGLKDVYSFALPSAGNMLPSSNGFRGAHIYGSGPGSVVGIATGYGLGGPRSNPGARRDFPHLSRPALGPPSLLYKGYRVFPGGKERPGCDTDPSPPSGVVVMKG